MYRFPDASETIREATGPVATNVFAVITELGGLSFLLVFLSVLYWAEDRDSTAVVISYTLVALVVTLALKQHFAAPRPPAGVRAVAESPDTSGFPSGHAIAATVVYGGLVFARREVGNPRYVVAAASVILLVGLSRVVIGVHYVGDVLAGYAVGVAVLGGLWLTVRERAGLTCLVAAGLAVATLPITAGTEYALLGVGGSLGGAVALYRTNPGRLSTPTNAVQTAVFVVAGLTFLGVTYWLTETVTNAVLAVSASFALVAGIFLFPFVLTTRPFAALAE